eukprot:scaffold24024_cov101-Isochrysis_galbana.AAC.3
MARTSGALPAARRLMGCGRPSKTARRTTRLTVRVVCTGTPLYHTASPRYCTSLSMIASKNTHRPKGSTTLKYLHNSGRVVRRRDGQADAGLRRSCAQFRTGLTLCLRQPREETDGARCGLQGLITHGCRNSPRGPRRTTKARRPWLAAAATALEGPACATLPQCEIHMNKI